MDNAGCALTIFKFQILTFGGFPRCVTDCENNLNSLQAVQVYWLINKLLQ